MRTVIVLLVVVGAAIGTGPAPATAAPLPERACDYVRAISDPDVVGTDRLVEVAVPGSDAYAYGVFTHDLQAASRAAGREGGRTVRCRRTAVEVDLDQYGLSIKPPKQITTVYDRFETAADGRIEAFRVNGTPITGRVVVGDETPAVALGTDVRLSSAYLVPRTGGEAIATRRSLLIAVEATAPTDGVRDLATGASTYRTATDEYLAMRTVGQGSPLQPGATSTWVMEYDARRFGGTLTLPVVAGSAMQSTDAPLEAVRFVVGG